MMGVSGEVIVADNGSTDRSVEIALSKGARVVHVAQKGYGNALRGGIEAARGRIIVIGDADDSYDFLEAPKLVAKIKEGYDLVVGSRFKGQILPGAMPWTSKIGNPIMTFTLNLLFKVNTSDSQSGMRAFTKEAYRKNAVTGDRNGVRIGDVDQSGESKTEDCRSAHHFASRQKRSPTSPASYPRRMASLETHADLQPNGAVFDSRLNAYAHRVGTYGKPVAGANGQANLAVR